MPPELPGFYFDQERGRYFRISSARERPADASYHLEEVKKRKVEQRHETELHDISESRLKVYQEYLLQLSDPFQRVFGSQVPFEFIGGLRIESHIQNDDHNTRINSSFGSTTLRHEICGTNLLCNAYSDKKFRLVFPTRMGLIEECVEESLLERSLFEICPHELPEIDWVFNRLEITESTSMTIYFHAFEKGSNNHSFGYIQGNEGVMDRPMFKPHDNVYDSLNLGKYYVVAVNCQLRVFEWNSRIPKISKTLNGKSKSDILSLAVGKLNRLPKLLYAGCRDGSISVLPIGVNGKIEFTSERRLKFPNVLSIISIKTVDTLGIIFVSAISQNSQALFMLDTLTDPCKPLLKFQTAFLNLTREKEIFNISPDGHYISYGSLSARGDKGDVEIFSSYLQDNLKYQQAEAMVFYPLRSLNSGLLKDVDLQNTKLRAVGLGEYPEGQDTQAFASSSCRLFLLLQEINSPEYLLPRLTLMSTDV